MLSIFSKSRIIRLLVALFLFGAANAQSAYPVVKTNKGCIRGISEDGIQVFKGIPYAAPPVGPLRFMPPVEHAAWNDTLQAIKFGAMAAQPFGNRVAGSEDCLFLNLYTPKVDNHKRAVVVWVHGGSMTNGTGMGMNGHAFADNDDIVTVTINYRLGALGFLYLGDVDKRYAASGNNGLLDCIMALRWIKENISSFGGDPNRITVMGESAGAKLLSAVMVAPKSKGLFRQLIAESGSVQCVRDTVTAKLARAKMLRQMGLSPQDASKLLTIPADSLMKIQAIVCAGIGGNSFFGPVYDGVIIKEDAYKYAGGENIPHIKALIGTNKYEAAAFVRPGENFANPDSTVFKPLFGATHQLVNRSYLQQLQTKAVYDALVNVLTQYMYQVHSYRFAKVLSQNGIPVWMYRFNFDNGLSFGAAHGRELHYIWNGYSSSTTDADSTNARLEHAMHSAWVAFIKTGNPNMKLLPPWPIYTNNSRRVMLFDAKDTVTGLTEVFDDKNFPSQVYMLK